MSDHPRMLYRKGGKVEYHGLRCETCIADSPDEERRYAGEGWRRTPAEAHGQEPQRPADDAQSADVAAVNDERDGLLQEIEDLRKQLAILQDQLSSRTEAFEAEEKTRAGVEKERNELQARLADFEARLAAAEKERDETRELLAAFDRDNDGKPGGSQPKAKKASTG